LAGRGRDPGRGAHLRPGPRPGADRGAPQHDRGQVRSIGMASATTERSLFDWPIIREATVDSLRKLAPQTQVRNPVMFVVYVGAILTALLWLRALGGKGGAPAGFIFAVSIWLGFRVLFANFAEAMAEGRGKAQAASLRKARRDVQAKRLRQPHHDA